MKLLDSVTVVIPAKDEGNTIGPIVSRCREMTPEVLVVDGHSADGTAEIAEQAGAKVLLDERRGKGAAIRLAIPHITGEITVFIDADGSHDPSDIPRLIEPIVEGKAEHVTGSRLIGGSSEMHGDFEEFFRLMGSALITACINWKFNAQLSDSQNGFRAIRTEVLRRLDLKESITTIEQEMIIKTIKKGYRITEVPCHEYKRRYGTSHIRLSRVSVRYVYSLIKYLFF